MTATTAIPDVAALSRPIADLLAALGSGVPSGTDPADMMRAASDRLDAVHAACACDISTLDRSWQGAAATGAADRAAEAQAATARTAERGNDIADVVSRAYADLRAAIEELRGILESFRAVATTIAPTAGTPAGVIAILTAAVEHLSRALSVVARIREQLDRHAAGLRALLPPDIPSPPVSTDPTAPSTGSAAGRIDAASNHLRDDDQPRTTDQALDSQAAPAGGVQVTLPDGSTATAPNQEAATAVRAALSQQGVPYVWGGNTPGEGLDCSSLTKYAYGEAGVELPRLAQEQGIGHAQIDGSALAPGDLAVWDGHVAMIIGNGQMVEAGDPVQVSPIRTENSGMSFYGFYRPTA